MHVNAYQNFNKSSECQRVNFHTHAGTKEVCSGTHQNSFDCIPGQNMPVLCFGSNSMEYDLCPKEGKVRDGCCEKENFSLEIRQCKNMN